jgi:DNA mismatch endonuclease (patch repair protein)
MCADVFSKKKRSEVMSLIRSKNTKPELYVRSFLHKKGYRFRLHQKNLPGSPDLVLKKHGVVIYVNGCFWHHHNCGKYKIPKTNRKFWLNKFKNNKKRDRLNTLKLRKLGWKVYKIWECKINKQTQSLVKNL